MALPPSIQDFNKALKRMRPGKAQGPDNIPLEILTHNDSEMRNRLMLLILKIWETKTFHNEFRHATVVTIFKKGDRSILTSTPTCRKDVENRIRAAHSTFGRLNCRIFKNHALTMVFRAVVLSTLLYACEIWTLYRSEVKILERFQQLKLRQILNISWESYTTNTEVLDRASVSSVEATIIYHRLRWAGHAHRMDPSRLPKKILYGEVAIGTRPRGAPKTRYKEDQLKRTLALTNISSSLWEETARDRMTWRRSICDGIADFEERGKENEETRRRKRRERCERPPFSPSPPLPCDYCQRLFHHRLGLTNTTGSRRRLLDNANNLQLTDLSIYLSI
ncbi:unnamed protein product [Acanthosepion pharaonis]|uniref:Uncharacterized protein n=1 Tax=Acanthosepion pharaonis TaxID=158019 RepID=A0A812DE95_ACAPH|nr:unnamed protein product [Sepia pharaonis]